MVTKCSELTEVQDNCKLFLTTEQTVDKITSRGICSEKKGVFFFYLCGHSTTQKEAVKGSTGHARAVLMTVCLVGKALCSQKVAVSVHLV